MTVLSIKTKLEHLLDVIIEKILEIEDYFHLPANVRASEFALFAFAVSWFAWFVFFDVESSSPVYRYIFNEAGWACIFGAFAVLHAAGVFSPAIEVRRLAVSGYAVVWFVWLVMAATARAASTAVPTIAVILFLSVYVAVRLSRTSDESDK